MPDIEENSIKKTQPRKLNHQ